MLQELPALRVLPVPRVLLVLPALPEQQVLSAQLVRLVLQALPERPGQQALPVQ